MWSTHPPSAAREDNAKQFYVSAPMDDRSAWALFKNPRLLRKQMSGHMLAPATSQQPEAKLTDLDVSKEELERQFDCAYLNRAYRGAYLGRSPVAHARKPEELYSDRRDASRLERNLASLYPESLSADLEKLKALEKEKATLEALRDRRMEAHEGIIKHRGRVIGRQKLPATIKQVCQELKIVRHRVHTHDRLCRSTHLTMAAQLGNGWEAYLQGLIAVLHYSDHTESNLQDVRGYLANVVKVITADRNVSQEELQRLLAAAYEAYELLERVYKESLSVQLDDSLQVQLGVVEWHEGLGTLQLPPPNAHNINQWMAAIDSVFNGTVAALSSLRIAALDQLLRSEAQVSEAFRRSKQLGAAPIPSAPPKQYPVLLPGQERPRQTRLNWWDRFQTADGVLPATFRFLVAGSIVASVLWVSVTVGS